MPAVPLRIRLTLVSTFANQLGITAYHVATDTGVAREPSVDNLNAIADHYSTFLATDFKAALSNETTFLGLRVRYEAAASSGDLEVRTAADADLGSWPEAGTMPAQLCGLIRKKAQEPGRRGRGRMYIPFPAADTANADGSCSTSYRAALLQIANLIVQPQDVLLTGGLTTLYPTLFSQDRTLPGFRIIATERASGFATQRRRGAFGKFNLAVL
jgi:hypothetical protein